MNLAGAEGLRRRSNEENEDDVESGLERIVNGSNVHQAMQIENDSSVCKWLKRNCFSLKALVIIVIIIFCLFIAVLKLSEHYLMGGISRSTLGIQTDDLTLVSELRSTKHPGVTFKIFKWSQESIQNSELSKYLEQNSKDRPYFHSLYVDIFDGKMLQDASLTSLIQQTDLERFNKKVKHHLPKFSSDVKAVNQKDHFKNAFLAVAYKGDWIEMSVTVHPDRDYRGKGTQNKYQNHLYIERDLQYMIHQWLQGENTTPELSLELHCAAALALGATHIVANPLKKMESIMMKSSHFTSYPWDSTAMQRELGEENRKYFGKISGTPRIKSDLSFIEEYCTNLHLETIKANGLIASDFDSCPESGCSCLIM